MPKYPVKEHLNHDGESFDAGASVDMPSDQAAPLIALGVLAKATPAKAAPAKAPQNKAAE